ARPTASAATARIDAVSPERTRTLPRSSLPYSPPRAVPASCGPRLVAIASPRPLATSRAAAGSIPRRRSLIVRTWMRVSDTGHRLHVGLVGAELLEADRALQLVEL